MSTSLLTITVDTLNPRNILKMLHRDYLYSSNKYTNDISAYVELGRDPLQSLIEDIFQLNKSIKGRLSLVFSVIC